MSRVHLLGWESTPWPRTRPVFPGEQRRLPSNRRSWRAVITSLDQQVVITHTTRPKLRWRTGTFRLSSSGPPALGMERRLTTPGLSTRIELVIPTTIPSKPQGISTSSSLAITKAKSLLRPTPAAVSSSMAQLKALARRRWPPTPPSKVIAIMRLSAELAWSSQRERVSGPPATLEPMWRMDPAACMQSRRREQFSLNSCLIHWVWIKSYPMTGVPSRLSLPAELMLPVATRVKLRATRSRSRRLAATLARAALPSCWNREPTLTTA